MIFLTFSSTVLLKFLIVETLEISLPYILNNLWYMTLYVVLYHLMKLSGDKCLCEIDAYLRLYERRIPLIFKLLLQECILKEGHQNEKKKRRSMR